MLQPPPAEHRFSAIRSSQSDRTKHASIRLTAVDPVSGYGLQVGDTITFTALVRDPNVETATGTVAFSSNDGYETCPRVAIHRDRAVCYLTFYSPGSFHVTARYLGRDHVLTSVTLDITVIPNTDD